MNEEDDDSAALAHQMELEQLEQMRALQLEFQRDNAQYDKDMTELKSRIDTNWRNLHGDHG